MPTFRERLLAELAVREGLINTATRDEVLGVADQLRALRLSKPLSEVLVEREHVEAPRMEWLLGKFVSVQVVCTACSRRLEIDELTDVEEGDGGAGCPDCGATIGDPREVGLEDGEPFWAGGGPDDDAEVGSELLPPPETLLAALPPEATAPTASPPLGSLPKADGDASGSLPWAGVGPGGKPDEPAEVAPRTGSPVAGGGAKPPWAAVGPVSSGEGDAEAVAEPPAAEPEAPAEPASPTAPATATPWAAVTVSSSPSAGSPPGGAPPWAVVKPATENDAADGTDADEPGGPGPARPSVWSATGAADPSPQSPDSIPPTIVTPAPGSLHIDLDLHTPVQGLEAPPWAAVRPLAIEPEGRTSAAVQDEIEEALQPASSDDALIGQALGPWKITRRLGEGGMGVVYGAVRSSDGLQAALKVLQSQITDNKRVVFERFQREARVVRQIDHPNIVRVYDVGQDSGFHYIAMELIGGPTLMKFMADAGGLDLEIASELLEQTLDGLGAAHEKGIIHRDIKPDNVILDLDATAKITDFGLARGMGRDSRLTQTGELVGTPYYMSPEQAEGLELDNRTDIYSLGVAFYHLMTGRLPFTGDNPLQIILKHINDEPVPLHEHEERIPVDLSRLILKMMAKKRDQRYESCAAVLADLARVRAGESVESLTPIKLDCPDCGQRIEYMASEAGLKRSCPHCGGMVAVPVDDRAAFLPPHEDLFFGKILVLNKMVTADRIAAELAQQEERRDRTGETIPLSRLLVDRGILRPSQVAMVQKAIALQVRLQSDQVAAKCALFNELATKQQLEKCIEVQKRGGAYTERRIVDLLGDPVGLEAGALETLKRLIDEYRRVQEDVLFGRLAVANGFATEDQVRQALAVRKAQRGRRKRLPQVLVSLEVLDDERVETLRSLSVRYLLANPPPEVSPPSTRDLREVAGA